MHSGAEKTFRTVSLSSTGLLLAAPRTGVPIWCWIMGNTEPATNSNDLHTPFQIPHQKNARTSVCRYVFVGKRAVLIITLTRISSLSSLYLSSNTSHLY